MLAMQNLADFRMQQQLAHELYRQQIMQRLPDPFMLPFGMQASHAHFVPTHPPLPEVNAKLENNELWQQFHKIGTEMIITKTGRRMFPSMRISLTGLEDESNYCVLLEMVPISDCRYKFSGSQWVPAGGAEPQSPQRMYLHPDSPATGAHWQSQALLFNKVKLTNNTLDSNGHIVLASMHKYQPRIHVIRTADLAQIPWASQQAFVFPETEFIAVTAYQNDRITKLKIDNNPFAKGFRETGQSRCKRKLSNSMDNEPDYEQDTTERSACGSVSPLAKRMRNYEISATLPVDEAKQYLGFMEASLRGQLYAQALTIPLPMPQDIQDYNTGTQTMATASTTCYPNWNRNLSAASLDDCDDSQNSISSEHDYADADADTDTIIDVVSTNTVTAIPKFVATAVPSVSTPKRSSFSISDILGNTSS